MGSNYVPVRTGPFFNSGELDIMLELLKSRSYECKARLKSSLQIFYGRHHNLVDHYEISISQMTIESFTFYLDSFFSPSLQRILPDLAVYE